MKRTTFAAACEMCIRDRFCIWRALAPTGWETPGRIGSTKRPVVEAFFVISEATNWNSSSILPERCV